MDVSEKIMKRRAAVERWKQNNREYYLKQKRELSARPEYRARMRERYRRERDELKALGYLPRKLGRPQLYEAEEAIEMRRIRANEASARYRLRKRLSLLQENNESTTSEDPNSESN